jgi:transcriptional regulator with XRE-family HTH domain
MVRPGRKPTSATAIQRGARLAAELRARREEQNLSQPKLAQLAAVEVETLRKIEAGRTSQPGFFTVVDLAHALGVRLADLETSTQTTDASGGVST